MSHNNLVLRWTDGRAIPIKLCHNPVTEFYYNSIKHLRHLDLFFGPRENPYHPWFDHRAHAVQDLTERMLRVNIEIDTDQLNTQSYLNYLHQLYFDRCTSGLDVAHYLEWTHIHDLIHTFETINGTLQHDTCVILNYRNLAGMLYKKFDRRYLQYATTHVSKGTCFLREQELGKDPVAYYRSGESADLERIKKISKPWSNLIPTLNIATVNYNSSVIPDGFEQWFLPFRKAWCTHWQQPGWQPWETGAAIPIGTVEDIDLLVTLFCQQDYPIRIDYETC